MSDATAAPIPAPRRRLVRIAAALAVLLGLLLLGALVGIGLSPSLRWSLRATASPAGDDLVWKRVPGNRAMAAAVDVRAILDSPFARELRPELERLAAEHGFDFSLTERNARLLALSSDGRGFVHGAAAGPRLSPLLLPRFDARWRPAETSAGAGVTDGSAVIVPLEPGLVAFAVAEGGADARPALEAGLEAAAREAQEPLLLEGQAIRIVVTPDATLMRRMVASVPRQAMPYVAGLQRLDARAKAGESLEAVARLTMNSPDGAAMLTGALEQLDQVLSTGLIAFLVPFLGDDAAVLGKLPPFDVSREGADVVVTMSATPDHIRALLQELTK